MSRSRRRPAVRPFIFISQGRVEQQFFRGQAALLQQGEQMVARDGMCWPDRAGCRSGAVLFCRSFFHPAKKRFCSEFFFHLRPGNVAAEYQCRAWTSPMFKALRLTRWRKIHCRHLPAFGSRWPAGCVARVTLRMIGLAADLHEERKGREWSGPWLFSVPARTAGKRLGRKGDQVRFQPRPSGSAPGRRR